MSRQNKTMQKTRQALLLLISNKPGKKIAEDASTGALAFTVSDIDTAVGSLTVTATSSNTAIIPDGNLTLAVVTGLSKPPRLRTRAEDRLPSLSLQMMEQIPRTKPLL